MENYAIYVHIPFCKARCGYCAFSSCTDFSLTPKYFDKLFEEIEYYSNKDVAISTVYLGGGTPSSVDAVYIDKLFDKLRANFNLSQVLEVSVECNPESVTDKLLDCLKRNGVNRLSFGLQSVNDATLKRIGRIHSYQDFLRALNLASQHGFVNINADLIVGLPETEQDFYHTVQTVVGLPLQHVSVYALELHEGTPLHKLCANNYPFTDDQLADMYDYACDTLAQNGFMRYEISNFAKCGYKCKHNLNYWQEGRYFAFGASASGFVGNIRYTNPYKIADYLATTTQNLRADCESLSLSDQANEYVMLGLRLIDGISLFDFKQKYNSDFFDFFSTADRLVSRNLLSVEGDSVFVPQDKLYVVNSILCELLNFDD